MSDTVPRRHPEAQTMAAFVDGTLSSGEVAAVAEHLRGCGDCRTVVGETAQFTEEEGIDRGSARPWWMYLAAAIVVAIAAVPFFVMRSRSPIDRLIAAAPHEHRVVEARLSGFPWARLQAPSRGEPKPDPADLKFTGAAGEVLDVTANKHDAASGRAKGVAYLVIGRRNDGITALERAATGSNDAKTWNDLAAARYASAVEDDRPSQLPEALADADHALRLDPHSAAALFNRALILEHLGVLAAARKAWAAYLAVDPNSEWSAEARAHLHKLSGISHRFDPKMIETMPAEQLVREFPEEARRYGEAVLLPDKIDRARAIGEALAAFNGEQLLRDAVRAVERARGADRDTLIDGYRTYRAAGVDYNKRNVGAAEAGFQRAAELFRQCGSPMADVAGYYTASAVFDQHRAEARSQLQHLLGTIDTDRHRALAAEIEWEIALAANTEGDWGSGAREASRAATAFQRLGERSDAAFVGGIAAISYEMMGERDLAWQQRVRTLEELSVLGAKRRLTTMLHAATFTLEPLDELAAASALVSAISAESEPDPLLRTEVLTTDARLAGRMNDLQLARARLAEARHSASKLTDPALRASAEAQLALVEAEEETQTAPRYAIALLDSSIPLFAGGHLRWLLPQAYLLRGRARRASGNEAAALADYAAAMQEIEQQESTIHDAESRLAFLDTATQIIDAAVGVKLARGETSDALVWVDRARMLTARRAPDVSPRTQSRNTAVIEYIVRPHSVTFFCVATGSVYAQTVVIEKRDLSASVDTYVEDIRQRAAIGTVRRDGSSLYRLLIAPVRTHLAGVSELVLVPDGELYAVPFAALWDDTTHQFLVEQYTIRFAPSAASATETNFGPFSPSLVIADPPAIHQPRLLASRTEASRVAAIHGAALLAGEAATRARFVELARGSGLIHFAGHANSDVAESYGALMLAPGDGDSGLLSSGDIARLPLERHPLVVLAACSTFRGNTVHVAGMSSLARSFLIAGARGVVGTLWEIDDDVSAPLFTTFHEQLRAGASPARSLRDAQLAAVHFPDARVSHPATWSPIEYLSV